MKRIAWKIEFILDLIRIQCLGIVSTTMRGISSNGALAIMSATVMTGILIRIRHCIRHYVILSVQKIYATGRPKFR